MSATNNEEQQASAQMIRKTAKLFFKATQFQVDEKALQRPPIKYIQTLVRNLCSYHKPMAKFIGSSMLNVSEVRQWDRNSKIAFVDKLISFVESSNGQKITCSSSKVVAGKNASETNALLQALALSVINSRQQTQNSTKQNFLSSASSSVITSPTSAELSSANKQTNDKHLTKHDDDDDKDNDDGGEEKRIALQSIAKLGEQTTFSTNQESHSANSLPIRQHQSESQRRLSNNSASANETANSRSSESGMNTSPTYAKNKLKQQTQENKLTFFGRRETLVVSGNNLQMNDKNRDVSAKKSREDKSETISDEKKLQATNIQENKQLRQDTFDQTNRALLTKLTNSFDTLRRQLDLLSLPSSQIIGDLTALKSEFERRKQKIEISM